MSASARRAIADAATSVPDVWCSPYYRQSVKPGDATVRLDRTVFPNRLGGVDTWQVMVMLPSDQADAEVWIEDHEQALVEALQPEMNVQSLIPSQLVLDTGTIPALIVQGTRESADQEEE